MEGGGGGWRKLRHACGEQDKSVNTMNRTMLKFRPIAPKPVVPGAAGSDGSSTGNKNSLLTAARTKRKYVRVRKNNVQRKKEDITKDGEVPGRVVKTLQLLPEKNDINHPTDSGSWWELDGAVSNYNDISNSNSNSNSNLAVGVDQGLGLGLPKWLSNYMGGGGSDPTAEMQPMRRGARVESWVTVECVTGTCMNVQLQGTFGNGRSMEAERVRYDLEGDTCPGFISDGHDRVKWLNGAFKRMVSRQKYASEIAVWLVMKDKLPYGYSAFTCQVKLQYVVGKDKYSQMVPCDLWRVDGGGFAWRLDVKAALTLGR